MHKLSSGRRITWRDGLVACTPGQARLGGTLEELTPHVRDEALGDRYWVEFVELFDLAPDPVLFVVADAIWQQHEDGCLDRRPRIAEIEGMVRAALDISGEVDALRTRRRRVKLLPRHERGR